MRRETLPGLPQQLEIIGLVDAIELLEVEHRASGVVCEQKGFELVQEMPALARIAKQSLDARTVDLAVLEILDDRQDQRPVRRAVEQGPTSAIRQNGELVIGSGDRYPDRR